MDLCVFCDEFLLNGEPLVTLTDKGCSGIQKANDARQNQISVTPGQKVHTKCRSEYVNPIAIKSYNRKRSVDSLDEQVSACSLRSQESTFSYKLNCLFCGCPDIYQGKKPEFKLIKVRTLNFKERVIEACNKFTGDWYEHVRSRVLFVQDLPAADAVYHQICSVNFRTGKDIPQVFSQATARDAKCKRMSGRPKDTMKMEAFLHVADFLEANDDEQITINDLVKKMSEFIEPDTCDPYSFKHMKSELIRHFGDRIIITDINGRANVVTFRSTASKILSDFHNKPPTDDLQEKIQIIETAAKLIKNDIKSIEQSKDVYADYSELSSINKAMEFLPDSLQRFLSLLFFGKDVKNKLASVGQAIMQATRPRVLLVPLQVGLGVQLHHHFQSKFLIDSLYEHGFCCSYSEVTKFERSSVIAQGTDIPNWTTGHFMQYAADNVDHNIRSLDGKNTFHGMGIIATVTPNVMSKESMFLLRKLLRLVVSIYTTSHQIQTVSLPCVMSLFPMNVLQDQVVR